MALTLPALLTPLRPVLPMEHAMLAPPRWQRAYEHEEDEAAAAARASNSALSSTHQSS